MTPEERAALRVIDPVPRWWFWRSSRLSPRQQLFVWGSDEFGRRDLAVRVPGGMLIVALWRFRDQSGPCVRCQQWEPTEKWEPPYCHTCADELADYADGCTCPSFLEDDYLDEPWPVEDCLVHAHLEQA